MALNFIFLVHKRTFESEYDEHGDSSVEAAYTTLEGASNDAKRSLRNEAEEYDCEDIDERIIDAGMSGNLIGYHGTAHLGGRPFSVQFWVERMLLQNSIPFDSDAEGVDTDTEGVNEEEGIYDEDGDEDEDEDDESEESGGSDEPFAFQMPDGESGTEDFDSLEQPAEAEEEYPEDLHISKRQRLE
jgi:hypothetical protein